MIKHTLRVVVILFCLWAVSGLTAGCGKTTAHDKVSIEEKNSRNSLPLPEIPPSITDPAERSSYAVLHFWDALDDCTPEQYRDTAFMEQSFSNFIVLLPYVGEADRDAAAASLLSRFRDDGATFGLIDHISRKYLDEPNSPMRSEEFYISFLRFLSAEAGVPEEIRIRAASRLEAAMKNRPGVRGADFRMALRGGQSTTLHTALASDTTLVVFYDPDCGQCREIMDNLSGRGIENYYKVLAVDVAGDRALWDSTCGSLPAAWEVAYAIDPVEDSELYTFPALPSLYLFAPGAMVLLKDFSL